MTKDDFMWLWKENFGNVPLVSFSFRTRLQQRWVRIHSLPDAKRTPTTPEEWAMLLFRHNTVLNTLFSQEGSSEASVYLVCGEYGYTNDSTDRFDEAQHKSLRNLDFTPLESVFLGKEFPQYFAEEQIMTAKFCTIVWKPHQFDAVLQAAARGEIRPLFVSFTEARICALYDGGLDCILPDEQAVEVWRNRFQAWLSPFPSGL